MARPKSPDQGVRVNVWIRPEHVKIWNELENKGAFVNLALEQCVGIMTFALLQKADPVKYHIDREPVEEVMPEFNEAFPLDPLTAKRLGKKQTWPNNSPKKQELW